MSQSHSAGSAPAWCAGASRRQALIKGIMAGPSVPATVLFATFLGFGALCRDVGLSVGHALFISGSVFALPGQVVLVDQLAQGVGLAGVAAAVTLTAVRLLPMTVSLMPYLRDGHSPRWAAFLLAHFIAITVWIEAMRRLPSMPVSLRVPYFVGFGAVLFCVMLSATAIGFTLAGAVPPMLSAGLLFLTPIYFFLSLIAAAQSSVEMGALVFGGVLGPLLYLAIPGFDLMLTGVVAGSAAYGVARWRQTRRP